MSYFNYKSKKIYYAEQGVGEPVVFLHGNAVSSKMFEPILPLYTDKFKVILIDFLGHGKSDRLSSFTVDLWQEEARQTIALLEHLKCGKVSLVGTSGGAWVAINAAMERPDLVARVVADSFDGRTLADDFSQNLIKERAQAKQNEMAAAFSEWCLGRDWEQIADMDMEALIKCAEEKRPLFWKPLDMLKNPLLLMGSMGDEMCRSDFGAEYDAIAQMTNADICIYETGFHPAIVSNAEQAAKAIRKFLTDKRAE